MQGREGEMDSLSQNHNRKPIIIVVPRVFVFSPCPKFNRPHLSSPARACARANGDGHEPPALQALPASSPPGRVSRWTSFESRPRSRWWACPRRRCRTAGRRSERRNSCCRCHFWGRSWRTGSIARQRWHQPRKRWSSCRCCLRPDWGMNSRCPSR